VTLLPVFPAVARHLHQPVIGAHPDQPRLFGRLRQRENHAGIFHADVVGSQPSGNLLTVLVVARQVGADDLQLLPPSVVTCTNWLPTYTLL